MADPVPRRLRWLPEAEVLGTRFLVAERPLARLLGLAFLRRSHAGCGLLIPRARSVHTFGMRFALDICFLDRYGEPLAVRRAVGPWRVVRDRRADAVLELPSDALLRSTAPAAEAG